MIAPIDPRTRQFYVEMGYSEAQVLRAYEYSIRAKIDILDALAMQQQSPPSVQQPPPKQAGSPPPPPQPPPAPYCSFLTPMAQLRGGDYEALFSRSSKFSPVGGRSELRQPNNPVGLLNVSNCCYLNSLLQCYFLMDKFRAILLAAEPLDDIAAVLADNRTKLKRVKGEYELLAKLQSFFTLMALTSKKYLDPTDVLQNLVDSVGEKLTYGEEKDLSEVNIMIIERLSEGLTFSKKFYQHEPPQQHASSFIQEGDQKNRFNSIFNPERGVIKQLFYGSKVEYYAKKQVEEDPIVSDFAGIILNPRFGTLQSALDEEFNFSVQIKGQTHEKQMFIREEPEYLFMYINRTEYDRQEQQAHKNDQKFVFDFVLYLDRYLQKYKEERGQKDERIRDLINMRNRVKEQISNLQILAKKMEECYHYAKQLEGWVEKLPPEEEFEEEGKRLNQQLAVIEEELESIESRREEYHLVYIFVHRGDAVSGHYWGYGRNGPNWYRFDINCRPIPQDQIILDLEKSAGTPYALLYVKRDNIPKMKYNYHTRVNAKQNDQSFCKYFDEKLVEEIVRDNILLHQEVQTKNNEIIKKKCFTDYIARYNALKKSIKRLVKPKAEMSRLDIVPLCNNFSLFLHTKQEPELFKFSIFQQALLSASSNKITIDRLMHQGDLLATIQKKFKIKCKGQMHLKNYAMVGKDLERYLKLQEEFQITTFEIVWALSSLSAFDKLQTCIDKLNIKDEFVHIDLDGALAISFSELMTSIRIRSTFMRSQQYEKMKQHLNEVLYITEVNNELLKIIMLKMVVIGFKFESIHKFIDVSDAAGAQIATINSANIIPTLPEMQSSLSITEEIQQLLRIFFAQGIGRKSSTTESASKIDKRSSSKVSNMQSVSSSGTSPFKSVGFGRTSSMRQKRASQSRLTTYSKGSGVLLDTRQTWKIEELQTAKANFDFPSKLIAFLKRAGAVVKIYRKAMEINRALTLQELMQNGIVLNQPKAEPQSLI